MRKSHCLAIIAVVLLAVILAVALLRRPPSGESIRVELLSSTPSDATTVVFIDAVALRKFPLAAQLYASAPTPAVDPEYAQFVKDTQFDYERDLQQVAIATIPGASGAAFFAAAQGQFDQKKIESYLSRLAPPQRQQDRQVFALPSTNAHHSVFLTFVQSHRVLLANEMTFFASPLPPSSKVDAREWRQRFDRVAGSPIFAVVRQDAAAGTLLAAQAPGGFQSPELATLINQLLWITVAGKPAGQALRVVMEGECPSETVSQQLDDMLKGILMLAQAGLNGPENRKRLDPGLREGYLEMLKGADVSRIDRGVTKSVRLVFDVTPAFLQAAMATPPSALTAEPEQKSDTKPTKPRK
jgi:hypothetical protein